MALHRVNVSIVAYRDPAQHIHCRLATSAATVADYTSCRSTSCVPSTHALLPLQRLMWPATAYTAKKTIATATAAVEKCNSIHTAGSQFLLSCIAACAAATHSSSRQRRNSICCPVLILTTLQSQLHKQQKQVEGLKLMATFTMSFADRNCADCCAQVKVVGTNTQHRR